MKKFLSILLVGLLCVCCFALGACKEDPADPKPEVFKTQSITYAGTTYNIGDTIQDGPTITEDFIVFTFNADGTVTATQLGEPADGTMTWTKDGNTYTLVQTIGSQSMTITATLEGDILTMDVSGNGVMVYVLKKAQ